MQPKQNPLGIPTTAPGQIFVNQNQPKPITITPMSGPKIQPANQQFNISRIQSPNFNMNGFINAPNFMGNPEQPSNNPIQNINNKVKQNPSIFTSLENTLIRGAKDVGGFAEGVGGKLFDLGKGIVEYPITLGGDVLKTAGSAVKSAAISLASGPASMIPGGAETMNQLQQKSNAETSAYMSKLTSDLEKLPQGAAAGIAGGIKSIFNPQTTTVPVVSKNPVTKFFVGNQPIESVQQAYEQGGKTQGEKVGAGLIAAINDILSIKGGKAVLKSGIAKGAEVLERNPSAETLRQQAPTVDQVPFTKRVNNLDGDKAAQTVLGRGGTIDQAAAAYEQKAPQVPKEVVDSEVSYLADKTAPRFDPVKFDENANPNLVNKAEKYDEVLNTDLKTPQNSKTPLMDLLKQANGKAQEGRIYASQFAKEIKGILTNKDDRTATRDVLEGAVDKSTVSDDVRSIANILRPINDKILAIGRYDNPDLGERENYGTRQIIKSNETAKPSESLTVKGFNNIADLFRKTSSIAARTEIHKFVDTKGNAKFGTLDELNLTRLGNNLFRDENGNAYKAVQTSAREIEQSGRAIYRKDIAKIAEKHLSEAAVVRARQLAYEEVMRNPEAYEIRDAANAIKGDVLIKNVPDLQGKVAPRNVAKLLQDTFKEPEGMSPLQKTWRGVTRTVTQAIILNPFIHGMNLLNQAIIATGVGREDLSMPAKVWNGMIASGKFGHALMELADPDVRQAMIKEYLSRSTFGTGGGESETVLTRALERMNLPEFNKLNAKAMEWIDMTFRLAAHKANREAGMSIKDSVDAVDKFMGDNSKIPELAQDIGLFYRWNRTQGMALYSQLRSPGRYMGANVATAVNAAIYFGLNSVLQKATGNQYASDRTPGELGMIRDIYRLVKDPSNAPRQILTSKTNPIIVEALNQLMGKNMYSGNTLDTNSARLLDLYNTLFAPAKNITKVTSGKQTLLSGFVLPEFGINLPTGTQAEGKAPYQAAPNAKGILNTLLNVPGAEGGTGVAQQKAYIQAKDVLDKTLINDKAAQAAVQLYMSSEVDNKGVKMQKSEEETIGAALAVAGSPKGLAALQQFAKSTGDNSLIWKLNGADLKTFLEYKAADSDQQQAMMQNTLPKFANFNNGQGLTDFVKEYQQYYKDNPIKSTIAPNPANPVYPTFTGTQADNLNTYKQQISKLDSSTKNNYLLDHPEVVDALGKETKYYNDLAVAQGGLAKKGFTPLTADEQKGLDTFSSLKGDKVAQGQWIRTNQDLWNSISTKLTQNSVLATAEKGAVEQYEGVPFSGQYLKDIASAAQGIANVGGNYQINPEAAYQARKTSAGSSYKPRKPLIIKARKIRAVRPSMKRLKQPKSVRIAKTQKPLRIAKG